MNDVTAVTRERTLPLDTATADRVTAFIASAEAGHYRQSLPWVHADQATRYRVFISEHHGEIVAVSFAAVSGSRVPGLATLDIARGPIFCHISDLYDHLKAIKNISSGRFVALTISPFRSAEKLGLEQLPAWQPLSSHNLYDATLVIDVVPEQEQWRSLRRSTRTAINKSRTLNYRIERADSELQYRDFARQFKSFAAERNIAPLGEATSAGLFQHFWNEREPHCALLLAFNHETPLGGILLLRNGNSFVYEWGWTSPEAREQNLPVMHRLIWEAIGFAREQGCAELDLGGYWVDRGNADPINHFKLGFSKAIRHYAPTHRLVLSPVRQRLANVIRRLR